MIQRILLVDDREDNLFSMQTILESEGYEFVKASSGREALKILLKEFDFALILMDVQMPNLNGFETAELIYERDKLKHIPIIFITANTYGDENMFKGYRAGAVDYIYKPVNADLLRAKVAVFVDLYKKKHQLLLQEKKLFEINRNLQFEINDRRASEEKIVELNKQLIKHVDRLEKANKDLDRFAFMASHDLQEPLRKILTFTGRVSARGATLLDKESLMDLQRVQRAALRMKNLIQDILTFSTLSTHQENFIKCDMKVLVCEALEELQEIINEKQADIDVGPLPTLTVYPGLIRPLFVNLVSNALKYAKAGVAPSIRIYSEERNHAPAAVKGTRYARIYIKDNGIGFDQRYAEQIFEMFKRLHSQSQYEGTGIGLALCKHIVEQHEGFINVTSKVGEGSTFILSFPLEPVVHPEPNIAITPNP